MSDLEDYFSSEDDDQIDAVDTVEMMDLVDMETEKSKKMSMDKILSEKMSVEKEPAKTGAHGGIFFTSDEKIVCKIALEDSKVGGLAETSLREVSALLRLQEHSEYVPKIISVDFSEGKLAFFMKRYQHNLETFFLDQYRYLTEKQIRPILFAIVAAFRDAEHLSICHRDIKPQNILLDTALDSDSSLYATNIVLADWGLARFLDTGGPGCFSNAVQTPWYRAPEIILNPEQCYASEIDLWSIGIIAYQLYTGHVPFEGSTEEDQLLKIFKLLGTPDNSTWPSVEEMTHYKQSFPRWKKDEEKFRQLLTARNNISLEAVDLISRLLEVCPTRRISLSDLLNHAYFQESFPSTDKKTDIKFTDTKFVPLDMSSAFTGQVEITPEMRRMLLKWLLEIQQKCHISETSYFLACYFLDLAITKTMIQFQKLQLVGVTCLLLAEKVCSVKPLTLDTLLLFTQKNYTREEMLQTEIHLLKLLNFQLFRSTEYSALQLLCRQLPIDDEVRQKTLTEATKILHLCVINEKMRDLSPQLIAEQILALVSQRTEDLHENFLSLLTHTPHKKL